MLSRRSLVKTAAVATFTAPWIARRAFADAITPAARPKVRTAIREALESAELGSTHEHTMPEPQRLAMKPDIFTLFSSYPNGDLLGADFRRRAGWGSGASVAERWRAFEPAWRQARNTGFVRMVEIALRDLYGARELTPEAAEEISARIAAANTPGINERVLRDRCRHKFIVLDDKLPAPQMPASDLFVVARRFDRFVLATTRFELDEIGKSLGMTIGSLAEFEQALETDFERNLRRTRFATVKTTVAYHRPLYFARSTRAEAERDFARVSANKALPPAPNDPSVDRYSRVTNIPTRNLQDYIFRRIVALAREHGLPVQIHTGYQISNNVIENARPTLLTNLFMDFPDVAFDLFHSSFPYLREAIAQAKLFRNVYLDMCWMHIISPAAARHALREYLDTLPSSRIMGFGGDCRHVEQTYGHSVLARDNIIRVLESMVADGDLDEKHAIAIGHRLLLTNAEQLFFRK